MCTIKHVMQVHLCVNWSLYIVRTSCSRVHTMIFKTPHKDWRLQPWLKGPTALIHSNETSQKWLSCIPFLNPGDRLILMWFQKHLCMWFLQFIKKVIGKTWTRCVGSTRVLHVHQTGHSMMAISSFVQLLLLRSSGHFQKPIWTIHLKQEILSRQPFHHHSQVKWHDILSTDANPVNNYLFFIAPI